jgi:LPS sulfotransferase NodH
VLDADHVVEVGGAASPPVTRYLVLSTQRSGTSYLTERMGAHPAVGAYGEILIPWARGRPEWPPGAADRPYYATYLEELGVDPARTAPRRGSAHRHLYGYLDWVYEPRRDFRSIGFKLMYDVARWYPELLHYLRSREVRVIHLIRRNVLDLYLSRVGMFQRRATHAWSAAEREEKKVQVNVSELRSRLAQLERQRRIADRALRAARIPVHDVAYEDLLADDGYLEAVMGFCGIDDLSGRDLSARMQKLAPYSHRDGVANYEQVAAELRGTPYERFLRPGGDGSWAR